MTGEHAEPGDEVRLAYVGRFEDGSVFAASRDEVAREAGLGPAEAAGTPLSFTVGDGEVIEGLDEAVRGLAVGEETTIRVPPAKGYGEYDPDRVREYGPGTFEAMVGHAPEIGDHVEASNGLHGDVTAVDDDAVEVDFNHELAGQTLVFEIRVLGMT
jgi:peptidyl-prolyl cis-trans isomerase B (cyclophilin B)